MTADDAITITDIDLASVLRYYGFAIRDTLSSNPSTGRRGQLTQFVFLRAHPQETFDINDIMLGYTNEILNVEPKRLLSESRHLRNLTHNRKKAS